MLIRYGFDIEAQLWQPTSLVTMMDVHASQRHDITWKTALSWRAALLLKHLSTLCLRLLQQTGNKLELIAAVSDALDTANLYLLRQHGGPVWKLHERRLQWPNSAGC
jgi:hypothetical protein